MATKTVEIRDSYDECYERLCRAISQRLRATATALVEGLTPREVLDILGAPQDVALVPSLGGCPIAVSDLRQLGSSARSEGRLFVVDNSLASSFGCNAVRLGAHVCFERLDRMRLPGVGAPLDERAPLLAVSLSKRRDLALVLPEGLDVLARLPRPSQEALDALEKELEGFDQRRRKANDAAQVVAAYLCCHPRVQAVRYPGLKSDPSFRVAASSLQDGFGPIVDFCLRESVCQKGHQGYQESDAAAKVSRGAGGKASRDTATKTIRGAAGESPCSTTGPFALADGSPAPAAILPQEVEPLCSSQGGWYRLIADDRDAKEQVIELERLLSSAAFGSTHGGR